MEFWKSVQKSMVGLIGVLMLVVVTYLLAFKAAGSYVSGIVGVLSGIHPILALAFQLGWFLMLLAIVGVLLYGIAAVTEVPILGLLEGLSKGTWGAVTGIFSFLGAAAAWIMYHVLGIDIKKLDNNKPGTFLWVGIGGIAAFVIFSIVANFIGASPADVTRFAWRLVRQAYRFIVATGSGTPSLPPHPNPGLALRALLPATSAIIVWYLVATRRPRYSITLGIAGYLLYLVVSPTPTGQRIGLILGNFGNIGQANLDGFNYETEAWARIAEIQADGKRTGRLVRTTAATACLDDWGGEILSTTGHRNLLVRGREGRVILDQVVPGPVVHALNRQEAVFVAFQYEEDNPTWSRGVLQCWVDVGHLEQAGVREVLAPTPGSGSNWWPFGGTRTASAAIPPPAYSSGGATGMTTVTAPSGQRLRPECPSGIEEFTLNTGQERCYNCAAWANELGVRRGYEFVMMNSGDVIPVSPAGGGDFRKSHPGDYCIRSTADGTQFRVQRRG